MVFYDNVLAYVGSCFLTYGHGFGLNDGFFNNSCIFRTNYPSDCFADKNEGVGFVVYGNKVFSRSGNHNVCGTTLAKWVAAGHDNGTTISHWPTDDELVDMGKRVITT